MNAHEARPKPEKTQTERFTETAKYLWLAIQQLAQVETRYGDEFQRDAHTEFRRLEKLLAGWLDCWNNSGDEPDDQFQFVDECQGAWEYGDSSKCDIYVQRGRERCNHCTGREHDKRDLAAFFGETKSHPRHRDLDTIDQPE